MVAYVVWDDVVAGSNPVTPNRLTKVIDKHMYYASLVQLVERRSPKPDVVGSSPTGRETVKYHVYMIYMRAKSCLEHYILLHWEWRDD